MNTVGCDIFSLFFDRLLFTDFLRFAIFLLINPPPFSQTKKEAKESRRKDQDVFERERDQSIADNSYVIHSCSN